MRAALLRSGRLAVEEIESPVPRAGQALVRTLACGICGSDLHRIHSSAAAGDPAPLVMGHEYCGELMDYGPGSIGALGPGTHVVSFPFIEGADGGQIIGYSPDFPGGFGERMVLDAASLLPVPNGLDPGVAALTEPMAVGEHAVGLAQIEPGDAAMVVGCGPVGLAVICALRRRGIGRVTALDFSAARRALAEKLGAERVVDPANEGAHQTWAELGFADEPDMAMIAYARETWSRRAVIFECVGAPGVIRSIIDAAPLGATIVVAGACVGEDRFTPISALTKELSIKFSNAYSRTDFAETLRRLAEGELAAAAMITRQIDLEEVPAAVDALAHPTEAKVMIRHR